MSRSWSPARSPGARHRRRPGRLADAERQLCRRIRLVAPAARATNPRPCGRRLLTSTTTRGACSSASAAMSRPWTRSSPCPAIASGSSSSWPAARTSSKSCWTPGGWPRGAEDLYHIIIKPNGVMMTTRGIATQEPLGKVQPWAAGATLAIRKQDAAWFVELAVPLRFAGPSARSPLWGVNFCRFATAGAESSSWAERQGTFTIREILVRCSWPRKTASRIHRLRRLHR